MALLFGTGGTPHSAKGHSSTSGIERIAELGLGCMEVEFVQGVKMGPETARQVGELARRLNVKLTAHAPYFVNLNSADPEKVQASKYRLVQTARISAICGVESVVFHTGVYEGQSPEEAYPTIRKNIEDVLNQLNHEDNHICFRPEVLGKSTQFGTLDEVLRLCTDVPDLFPCVDFAHWHARIGANNSYPEFAGALQKIEDTLGRRAIDNMHMHISGIKYGQKGELAHLNFKDSDFNYTELLRALKKFEAGGFAICESPNLEEDAQLLQSTYNNLSETG